MPSIKCIPLKYCFSDGLFRRVADLMVSEGYKDAGYEYVIVDDCWLNKTRSPQGYLQPDSDRFPHGIKALADYVSRIVMMYYY